MDTKQKLGTGIAVLSGMVSQPVMQILRVHFSTVEHILVLK